MNKYLVTDGYHFEYIIFNLVTKMVTNFFIHEILKNTLKLLIILLL